jgi:hypothetical protein
MSYMFEVYYQIPLDAQKETELSTQISRFGGYLTFREPPGEYESASVCLTYEFDELSLAEAAAETLRLQGEHVEGPVDYGS